MVGGLMSKLESKKRYREKHKKLGLCVECPRKAVEGRTLCLKHKVLYKIRREKSS